MSTTKRPRKAKKLPRVEQIGDFLPGCDWVERRGNQVFVVNSNGLADVEVEPREISGFDLFLTSIKAMNNLSSLARAAAMVGGCATLSPEGRAERLGAIYGRMFALGAPIQFSVEAT